MAKDSLARGARSAQFGGPAGVSQAKWDGIFKDYNPTSNIKSQEINEETESGRQSTK